MTISYSNLRKKALAHKTKVAHKRPRMYAPIWQKIKEDSAKGLSVTVTCADHLQSTVIKGVVKEKNQDTAFAELGFTKLDITRTKTSVTFKLLDYRPLSLTAPNL